MLIEMGKFRSAFFLLAALAVFLLIIGNILVQADLVPTQMTYGNFDLPGKFSFVNRLNTGVFDFASRKIYSFTGKIHWAPFVALVLVLFPLTLFIGVFRNREVFKTNRVFYQWLGFVLARLGFLRASHIWPIRRSCFGTFPFLNCQACEMATGACPVGLLQNLLIRGIWPFYLVGSLILFGLVLGKTICGWLCPFGFVSDLFDRFSLQLWRVPRKLSHLRYFVLFLTVFAAVLFPVLMIYDRNFFCSTICIPGKILGILPYYFTTARESFFPVSRWLGDVTGSGFTIAFHLGLTLIALIAMLLISGRLFCRVLCPLGGFWGLFNYVSLAGVRHNARSCVGCGKCESVCPMGVSSDFQGFIDRTSCMSCGKCISECSSGSRHFKWGPDENMPEGGKGLMEPFEVGYGNLTNRLRRDFYMIVMSVLAKSPIGMAKYAFDYTDYYHQLYKNSPTDFSRIPLVLKQSLGEIDPYSLLSGEMVDKIEYYGETTGSTGNPTPAFYTSREFHAARIFSQITPYVGVLQKALAENRAVVNGLTFGFTIAGMSFGDFLQFQGGVVANIGSRSTIATPERMARALTRIRPSLITGTPIDFLSWMRILREDFPNKEKEVLENLRGFISTAELCSSSRRKAIEREFNLKHIDVYACVEGFFSIPCPCGEKHVLPAYYTEVFDDCLNSIGQTGEGRLAFTNLLKKSTPMVRYLLDDFVSLFPSACPFGFKKSVEPHGRYELTVCIGEKRFGVRHFEEAIFNHGLFGDYRVILEDESMSIKLEEYGAIDSISTIEDSLSGRFGMKVKAEVLPFGELTKYREVRVSKPILKVEDKRSVSTQKIPEFL